MKQMKSIGLHEAQSYAVSNAINEAATTGLITPEAASFLYRRADEFYAALLTGKVLQQNDKGFYEIRDLTDEEKRSFIAANTGELIIGGGDEE
jgi:hypothetical protein